MDCKWVNINMKLYNYLQLLANPCIIKDESLVYLRKETNGTLYKSDILVPNISNLNNPYNIKKMDINDNSITEKQILNEISRDILSTIAPKLFPFIYQNYTCMNEIYLILQPSQMTINNVINIIGGDKIMIQWWIEILYQVSKAVEYLESKQINHNNLTLDTITLQYNTTDYNNVAIMLIDFGKATKNNFKIGKDMLDIFLHLINNSDVPQFVKNIIYNYNMENGYIPNSNNPLLISGKRVSIWLGKKYPFLYS